MEWLTIYNITKQHLKGAVSMSYPFFQIDGKISFFKKKYKKIFFEKV